MAIIGDGGPAARAERVRSAYYGGPVDDGGDGGDWESPSRSGGGLVRILVVVILLHMVGIAGVLGYRWMHRDLGVTEASGFGSSEVERPPVEELVPAPRTNGKAIVVDHPTLKGHIRYRVAKDEQLSDVARRFNASVAEVEKLNALRQGTPLYAGQWLTVPDHRERLVEGMVVEAPAGEAGRAAVIATPGETPREAIAQPVPVVDLPPPPAPPAMSASGGPTYRVASGDTAYRIALRYGITWQELLEYNGLTDPQKLQAGQVLKIPPKR